MQVEVDGPLTVDSQEQMADAAIRGLGLACVWEQRAASCLQDGKLIRCLDEWCPIEEGLFLYFPTRKHQPSGLRAVMEALKA